MRLGNITRDSNGRFVKETILNKIKFFCNAVITKIEKWIN